MLSGTKYHKRCWDIIADEKIQSGDEMSNMRVNRMI